MRAFALLALALAACGFDPEVQPAPVTALFEPPGTPPSEDHDFYALPYPNDVWRTAEGTLDLADFPTNSLIVDTYRMAAQTLDGFGLNAAMYARFSGALDPASLPDPAASMTPAAAVYLVDIDPDSPTRGERVPVVVTFRTAPTDTLGPNHIAVRPYPGFGLADGTTYALVVTSRVRADKDNDVVAGAAFDAVLAGAADARVTAAYAPLLAWLDEPGDDERADVVSAAVFTTQTATAIGPAIRAAVFTKAAAPRATGVVAIANNATFQTFTGNYKAANLQAGTPPYRNPPEGAITVGPDGAAIVQRLETMRFALTVPVGAVPAKGFPIAIYSHGTGGDFRSFIDDGTASALAAQGIAVISTDQVLHGPRNPGGNPELDFFNIANPFAMRDNALQGAADAWSQLRLVRGLSIVDSGRTIKFDRTKVYFFGHSQGGLTGPSFVAFEPTLSGAVFSGTGGLLYLALLYKTAPIDIPMLVQTFLRDDPVDENNPSLALFQAWAERADGANYAPLMVRKPQLGPDGVQMLPRNIFQTEGFTDTFTPNLSIEAFAVALGGDVVMLPDAKEVPGLALRSRTIKAAPFADNLGPVTAALAQYNQQPGSDGHFVVFDIPNAERQASEFLGTLSRTGTATVVAPN